MENQPAKRKAKDDDGSDRISELPESVLLRILCFLSLKKSVQTCVLSKSWRRLGPTRPVINLRRHCSDYSHAKGIRFCENCFYGNQKTFISFLDSTFQRYHHHNVFPQELRLEELEVNSESISLLEKWIPVFVKPNTRVTTFQLSFRTCPAEFDLPSAVFQAESLREICLQGCRLNEISLIDNVALKNLQKLSLSHVSIDDEALEKIISGSPSLEYVALYYCRGVKAINIANKNHYLKHFEFFCSCAKNISEHSVEIGAPTLRSIRISSCLKWHHNYFPHLKYLQLSSVHLSAESFHNFSGNFLCLEELLLLYCHGFEEIKLSSRSIKRLIIKLLFSVKKVDIDAQNLLYFEFYSSNLLTTFSLTETSKECESYLGFSEFVHANYDALSILLGLIEMVKTLSKSQISLELHENLCFRITQIEWSFNDHPIVVEHLSLSICRNSPVSLPRLLNALFPIFRPRYTNALPAFPNDNEIVTEFLWKTLIQEREKMEYGWAQNLEEVSIEASDEKGKVWRTCLPEWSKNQKIRFRLKWS